VPEPELQLTMEDALGGARWGGVSDWFDKAGDTISKHADNAHKAIKQHVVDPTGKAAKSAVQTTGKAFDDAGNAINQHVINPTGKAFDDAGRVISQGAKSAVQTTGKAFDDAGNAINQHVINPTGKAFDDAGRVISQGAKSAVQTTGKAFDDAGNAINQHVINPTGKAFDDAGRAISQKASKIPASVYRSVGLSDSIAQLTKAQDQAAASAVAATNTEQSLGQQREATQSTAAAMKQVTRQYPGAVTDADLKSAKKGAEAPVSEQPGLDWWRGAASGVDDPDWQQTQAVKDMVPASGDFKTMSLVEVVPINGKTMTLTSTTDASKWGKVGKWAATAGDNAQQQLKIASHAIQSWETETLSGPGPNASEGKDQSGGEGQGNATGSGSQAA